jgi:hypothetical protein
MAVPIARGPRDFPRRNPGGSLMTMPLANTDQRVAVPGRADVERERRVAIQGGPTVAPGAACRCDGRLMPSSAINIAEVKRALGGARNCGLYHRAADGDARDEYYNRTRFWAERATFPRRENGAPSIDQSATRPCKGTEYGDRNCSRRWPMTCAGSSRPSAVPCVYCGYDPPRRPALGTR